jgi:hypothetical protein
VKGLEILKQFSTSTMTFILAKPSPSLLSGFYLLDQSLIWDQLDNNKTKKTSRISRITIKRKLGDEVVELQAASSC